MLNVLVYHQHKNNQLMYFLNILASQKNNTRCCQREEKYRPSQTIHVVEPIVSIAGRGVLSIGVYISIIIYQNLPKLQTIFKINDDCLCT